MSRKRRQALPPLPNNMEELVFDPDIWTTFEDNQQRFVLYDNRIQGARIVIFASNVALQYLCTQDRWFMDGNFNLSPANLQFQQIYVIRCPIGNTSTTCVYALLQLKTAATYRELLETVLVECRNRGYVPNPRFIHMDYEMAVINAATLLLPNAAICGCFYHLCQVMLVQKSA